jgi:uncharacterized membrane protein
MPDSGVGAFRQRSLERVTAFTDGTVAIALTLLVLPLVDIAQVADGEPVLAELVDHRGDLFAFVVSFLVIAQFWNGHRRLFETLDDYDERLLGINTAWLLAVVFLPYPTARLFFESQVDRGSAVLYLGAMLAAALLGVALAWYVARHPRLRRTDLPALSVPAQLAPTVGVSVAFALALAIASVWPVAGLLSLVAFGPMQRLTRHLLTRTA